MDIPNENKFKKAKLTDTPDDKKNMSDRYFEYIYLSNEERKKLADVPSDYLCNSHTLLLYGNSIVGSSK